MKKEEKFHSMKIFCTPRSTEPKTEAGSFNPQVLFATYGAANCGIDNSKIHGVFCAEVPPSAEDMIQEEGRAGRRINACSSTDCYTVCISLESLLKLWIIIYMGTVDKLSYRRSLSYDCNTLDCLCMITCQFF